MSSWTWIAIVVAVILIVILTLLQVRRPGKNKKSVTVKPMPDTANKPDAVNKPDTANKIVFITGPQTVKAGAISGIITIQIQDVDGNPVKVTSDTVITLSSSLGGTFGANRNGLPLIKSVTVHEATDSANFYYKESTKGNPTIIAFNEGLVPGKQTETIN
jgi:hypothetical protein